MSNSEPDNADETASVICPHCAEPVSEFDHFCPSCAGPVTAHASIDPLGQVYAMGHGYRQAVASRPRLIVVVGMWILLGPQVLVLLLVLVLGAYQLAGTAQSGSYPQWSVGPSAMELTTAHAIMTLVRYTIVLFFGAIYTLILWKVTRRYISAKPGHCAECGYNLRGSVASTTCPECGTPIEAETLADIEQQP